VQQRGVRGEVRTHTPQRLSSRTLRTLENALAPNFMLPRACCSSSESVVSWRRCTGTTLLSESGPSDGPFLKLCITVDLNPPNPHFLGVGAAAGAAVAAAFLLLSDCCPLEKSSLARSAAAAFRFSR
jgi:hypothetical protein